ncbi:ATP-dependent RNA helicase DOB1 [Ceratobasidium sp. AG-Ba]|nr:ATP-dependent RNA helicase DOB1 [Ceratobasidium sp. AG-Ba]
MDSTGHSPLPPPYEPGAAAPNASDNPPRWASASDPPAFDADIVPGYDTTTPSKLYKVGKLSTLPLVTIADIKAHLLLLGAFEQLKQKCEEADVVDVQKKLPPLCTEAKWPLFLERARERFYLWVAKVINARPERSGLWHEEIPPLDVLLIWHAYLLNPIQYHEDVVRMHPILDKLSEFPLYKISSQIDLETLEMLPTEEQFHYWQRTTGDCFGLPLNTTPDADTIKTPCPSCNHTNEITWVSAPDSSGKLRGFPITWEALCTKRFAEDVVLCLKNSGATLAGTLMSSSGSPDTEKGRRLTELILGAFPGVKSVTELANHFGGA